LENQLSRKKTTIFNDIGGNLEEFYKNVVEHIQVYIPLYSKTKAKLANGFSRQYK